MSSDGTQGTSLAHGVVFMAGAYATSAAFTLLTDSYLLSVVLATAAMAAVAVVAAVAVAGLHLFLTRTRVGTAMRATNRNPEAARAVGIDPYRIFLLTFAIASALAALGSARLGPLFLIFPAMGDQPLLKGLTAIVLDGVGSVPGAILGGLAIGVAEAESTLFLASDWRDAIVFGALIAALLLRPQGLFSVRLRGEA